MKNKIAVLIPCYNEELTLGTVIQDFRKELPDSSIYVFDNNSRDRSVEIALANGARVIRVPRQGKGYVVQSMFDMINADYYVMVDGDGTYPASYVHQLLEPVQKGQADMVVGSRLQKHDDGAFKPLHWLGNVLVSNLVARLCRTQLKDVMSGYRAYNGFLTRTLPLLTAGFEIETELTIQALDKGFHIIERPVPYGVRPEGSVSKLRTFKDGYKVIMLILSIYKDYKPLSFFGGIGLMFGLLAIYPAYRLVEDFMIHRAISQLGMAFLFSGLSMVSVVCIHIGILLHSLSWKMKELYGVIKRSQMERFLIEGDK